MTASTRDLGSHNGPTVNDVAVKDQVLAHRDRITVGRTVLQFLIRDDVVFEDPGDGPTFSIPVDRNSLLTASPAPANLHALLKVSAMLHSFHAIYRGRGRPPATCWSGNYCLSSSRSFPRVQYCSSNAYFRCDRGSESHQPRGFRQDQPVHSVALSAQRVPDTNFPRALISRRELCGAPIWHNLG